MSVLLIFCVERSIVWLVECLAKWNIFENCAENDAENAAYDKFIDKPKYILLIWFPNYQSKQTQKYELMD